MKSRKSNAYSRFLKLVSIFSKTSPKSSSRISVKQYNLELESSEKEIEAGNFYTSEQVRKKASRLGRK